MEVIIAYKDHEYTFGIDDIVMVTFLKDIIKSNPEITKKKPKIKKEVKKNGSST